MTFEDILDDNGIRVAPDRHHHSRSGWVQFDCPFCGEIDKFHMGYNKAGKYLNCWVCGPSTISYTLMVLLKLDYPTAKALAQRITKEKDGVVFKPKGKLKMPSGYKPNKLCKAHMQYLRSRSFKPNTIRKLWSVGCTATNSDVPHSIIIPIHYGDQVVSWTARYIGKNQLVKRYRSAHQSEEAYPSSRLLYGAQYARHAAIIVEGPTDVWRIGPGAVGTLGLSYTQDQFLAMLRYSVRVICFDNTKEAQKKAELLTNQLSVFPGETYNVLIDADDPGACRPKEVRAIRKVAGL